MHDVLIPQATSAATSEGDARATDETTATAARPPTLWQVVHRSLVLQILLLLFVFVSVGTGAMFEVALPALLHDQLHTGASGYGIVLAGFSFGAIAGSLAAGGLGKIPYRLAGSLLCFIMEAALIMLIPFMGNVGIGVLITLAAGVLNGLVVVTIMSIIQSQIPMHLMGRVMSLPAFANFGLYPISVAVAGVIVPRYGSVPVFLVGGLLLAIPALVGCLQPSFWRWEDVKMVPER